MGRRLLAWKDLLWWQGERRQRKGAPRHAGRFNPALDVQRSEVKIAGVDWKLRAQDRGWWQTHAEDNLQQFNVPWASGKQSQLENLEHNTTSKPAVSERMSLR